MQVEVLARPAGAAARVKLLEGEVLTAEVGSMIAMSQDIEVETTSKSRGGGGGFLKGVKRMLSGESYFLNHFTSLAPDQEIIVGPDLVGDIVHHKLAGGTLIVQSQSWLASSAGIDIDTTWQGFTAGLFSGEAMFWVKLSGEGDVLLNSFGAIYEVQVTDGYVVDSGHIVAFEDTLSFAIGKASESLIGSILGGEGLVCKFSGQGKLWCQTHNPPAFGSILGPKLKPR